MLHEVAASDLDVTHIVNPIRKMLRHVRFFEGEVLSVHLAERRAVVAHGFDRHTHSLEYDHIVFGLGCVINFFNIPGLRDKALTIDTNAASLDLAQRQHEVGNITDLAPAEQQASYSRSRLDVATTEVEIFLTNQRDFELGITAFLELERRI